MAGEAQPPPNTWRPVQPPQCTPRPPRTVHSLSCRAARTPSASHPSTLQAQGSRGLTAELHARAQVVGRAVHQCVGLI